MADEIDWLDLPGCWTYGVDRGGRIFFINDEEKSTSWVHPGTGSSIQSGQVSSPDLPKGWEMGYTQEDAVYFINHNERRNTFLHPVTGQTPEENRRFDLKKSASDMSSKTGGKRPTTTPSDTANNNMVSEVPPERPSVKASRISRKAIAFGKRSNSMKRNPNAAVTKSGWLFKQASSGVKQWNKRWFVLVDRCLFYYKDEKEESILGSIPLLSFRVGAVQPSDNISRKYTFKVTVCWAGEAKADPTNCLSPQAEHAGVRTYFFSAESPEEQDSWIQAMGEAARVQIPPAQRSAPQAVRHNTGKGLDLLTGTPSASRNLEKPDSENIPPSKLHHHHHQPRNSIPKPEPESKTRGEGDGRGCEKTERKLEQAEVKKEPLLKANGVSTGSEPALEPGSPYPEAPRVSPGGDRGTQPNGWQYSSPSRPGSTAFPPQDGESIGHRRSFPPRTNLDKIAQRKSSMNQLQQWVNLRRGAPPPEDLRSPSRFYPVSRRVPDYYGSYSPQYPDDYQYYPPGVRPDSICSMPAYDRISPSWTLEEKRHSFRNGGSNAYQLREWKEPPGYGRQDGTVWIPSPARQPVYYDELDAASASLRRLSLQPRSHSVPRSPSQGSYSRARVYSPARSPSARFERLPPRSEDIYADPAAYVMRRSVSSPKYDYLGDRRPVPAGIFPYNYPPSPTVHDKMDELLDLHLQRNLEYLDQQVPSYSEVFRDGVHTYKLNEQDTDKLLGKLCEQNKVVREQDRLVQQLRAEKESLESALMGTHQEMEMFGSQSAYPEKLLHKKESLQNQLINIRVELSQATTPKGSYEQGKKDPHQTSPLDGPRDISLMPTRQELEAEKQAALNKVGIVPPRTKSPTDEEVAPSTVVRRSASGLPNGPLSRQERPKSAMFPNEVKAKMSVEEQIDRMRRHQNSSMKEKRRSLQLPAGPSPDPTARPSYKVVRRHRSIHEVDISNLEAALRAEEPGGQTYETPQEEIARLRKMELEPQHYDVDITKELSTPDKVFIPERYIELEPETPLSPEEMKEKQKKVERIKTLIAKSSMQNVVPMGEGDSVDTPQDPETQLQEQEKRIEISCTLATEASRRGRMLSAQCATPSPPTSPASPTPPANPLSSDPPRGADNSHSMRV
ncbi:pleckstrin homology domain-containing family A member 6 isoform X17 [Notamacropus eugenii]|uniref:pleckstrin homology domain-containing family A member 6 isoform X17 n=1 Tax=Notamacropus eugenii TaxID=9315 RepID=UPI003B67D1C0